MTFVNRFQENQRLEIDQFACVDFMNGNQALACPGRYFQPIFL